jgi:hypothetical protein
MIQLLQSREPLLALRGARGIARACFKAPAGSPDAGRELGGVKAQVVKLGGIAALVDLLRDTNTRCVAAGVPGGLQPGRRTMEHASCARDRAPVMYVAHPPAGT